MQKFVNFNIDTTIDNSIELEKRINKGDTLKFTIKVFNNGVLSDLTNDIVNLVLLKADGTILEDVTTTKSNGIVTFYLSQQATLSEQTVTGTLQITESSTSHLSTNIFTYFVNPSITDSVLEASTNEIKSLGEVMAIIKNNTEIVNNYVDDITAIAGTTESVQALANIKVYVDTNLPLLISENNEAVTNIANENTQNDEATQNISDLTTINNTTTTLKNALEIGIASGGTLKTGLENNIATGSTLKNALEVEIASGGTLKTGLELSITNGTTLKGEIIAENIIAEANIEAMQSFGDITALSQTVTDIKTEVETARGASANLDSRLDLVDTSLSERAKQLGGGCLINGDFRINQRIVSGTITLTAGQYGHDRWKAGASGCTYTFVTSGGKTTITITAGSLMQVIEGTNLQTGTYVLSWGGTAQGKIGTGSYSTSGVSASVTGGVNLNIEFGIGTLYNAKLEKGTIITPFIQRLYGEELVLCQRYYEYLPFVTFWKTDLNALYGGIYYSEKRVVPTVIVVSVGGTAGKLSAWNGSVYTEIDGSIDSINNKFFRIASAINSNYKNYDFMVKIDAEI